MTIKSICPTLWKLYVTIYFPRSYWHSSTPKYHHLRRVFNEIEHDHQHLGVMKIALNDIFMHDQQPVIAMITRSSP